MELPQSTKEPEYENWGYCPYCLLTMEAVAPHGERRRHKATKVAQGECEQAKNQTNAKT